jgi:LuxR family maltose regulon positive regulatory protein
MATGTMDVPARHKPQLNDVRWGLRHSQLQIPSARITDVPRLSLIERLSDPTNRVICVVAPPGYGKTTLMAQYARHSSRSSAWLSVGEDCNDPIMLGRYLAFAIEPYAPLEDELLRELEGVTPRPSILRAGLGAAVRHVTAPFLFVIDDHHNLTDPSATELIRVVMEEAPPGCQVALAGLHPAVAFGVSEASESLVEIGVRDLAFHEDEAASWFRGVTAEEIEGAEISTLLDQTEGWPAAVYLAALSRRGVEGPVGGIVESFRGDHRLMASFFREAVLSRLPSEQVDFLIRTAVLDELFGPLCDAVLETTGSGARLEELEDANLFLVPLDQRRERYRYHHLFREWLLMELRHRTPDLEPTLTARASEWCEQHGSPDQAIEYALAGHDVDRVAGLALRYGQRMYYSGRAASLSRWFDWIAAQAPIESYPALAVIATWFMAMEGRPVDADRWAAGAASGSNAHLLPPELEAVRLLARATMCRDGVEAMEADAELAVPMLPPGSPWVPLGFVVLGLSSILRDDLDSAVARFEDCVGSATQVGTGPAEAVALTELAICALHRGDVSGAATSVRRARDTIDRGNLRGYFANVLTCAVAARVTLVQGDHVKAQRFLDEADESRGRLTEALPPFAIQAYLELARCSIGLGDVPASRGYLEEAGTIARHRPGLGTLIDELRELEVEFETLIKAVPEVPSLTPAEARLLPFLTTHLSFREIGEQLFLSPHTIKTQAISIYRKLGVTSRAGAVEAAHHLGLISG